MTKILLCKFTSTKTDDVVISSLLLLIKRFLFHLDPGPEAPPASLLTRGSCWEMEVEGGAFNTETCGQ